MQVHTLLAAAAAAVLAAGGADAANGRPVLLAQADTDQKPADQPAPKPKKKKSTKKKKKAAVKKVEEPKPAEAAPAAPAPDAKAAETPLPAPAPAPEAAPTVPAAPAPATVAPAAPEAAPAPAATPAPEAAAPGGDSDAPTLSHTAITHAPRGKSLRLEAHAVDPNGVFQVVLYMRRQGGVDFIPLKLAPDKAAVGNYSVEVPTALMSTNLEYYIETYDELGNGPARAGSPEHPLPIKLDEPPKPVEKPAPIVIQRPKGQPPAITHAAVSKAYRGKNVEVNSKLKGETGVSNPVVKFRQLGDNDWKTLPMGQIGKDQFTATIPSAMTSKDIEYYLEAFDKNGNGPSHSASADAPYLIRIEDEPPPKPLVERGPGAVQPRRAYVPPPFKPNPGKAAGYFALAASLGTLVFAGGEAYAAWQSNENYTHTLKYEGRDDRDLLKRANDYGDRAKTFAIIGGISAVAATVLLIVFQDKPEAPPAGSGGDAPLFRF